MDKIHQPQERFVEWTVTSWGTKDWLKRGKVGQKEDYAVKLW